MSGGESVAREEGLEAELESLCPSPIPADPSSGVLLMGKALPPPDLLGLSPLSVFNTVCCFVVRVAVKYMTPCLNHSSGSRQLIPVGRRGNYVVGEATNSIRQ